jgi:hypothetical protein
MKNEKKKIQHKYTPSEVAQLHTDLLNALSSVDRVNSELDQVKTTFKAKIAEQECRVVTIRSNLGAGFEFRDIDCRCEFAPAIGKKHWYRTDTGELALTEEMSQDDFQRELFEAEEKFDEKREFKLWEPKSKDEAVMVIGRREDSWFVALRLRVGAFELQQRLDSEQVSFKMRSIAVEHGFVTMKEWVIRHLGDMAEGFYKSAWDVLKPEMEKTENN